MASKNTTNGNKQHESFKSIQILSGKAHSLWSRAKRRIQKSQNAERDDSIYIPAPRETHERIEVEIAQGSVLKTTLSVIAVFLAVWALFALRGSLLIIIVAFFISTVIDSGVSFLERLGLPRSLSVLLMYLVFLTLALLLIVSLVPIVAAQLQEIARFISLQADSFLAKPEISLPFVSPNLNVELSTGLQRFLEHMQINDRATALNQFGQNLSLASAFELAKSVAGSVLNFFVNFTLVLFLTFFIQMEKEKIFDFVRVLLPRQFRHYFDAKSDIIYHKMAQWAQGQIILCLSIGILVFTVLKILGMPYATTLALLAGFTEFIPYAGPLIAAIPAILIAFTQGGPILGTVVAIMYYVIQSCENHLLVPLIMKHTVGLSPIAVIVGMMVGVSFPNTIHPVIGIILAVPTTTIITIFLNDLYEASKLK